MASKTGIFNAALIHLGDPTVVSDADESSEAAALLRARWEAVLDATLRGHPWNCARARKALPALGDKPAFGYGYQYLMPTAPWCLRVLSLYDSDEPFEVEGRNILTNAPAPLKIRFVYRLTDPGLMDPMLAEALGLHLAYAIAFKRSGENGLAERLKRDYVDQLRQARNIDGQEGTAPDAFESEILMVRG